MKILLLLLWIVANMLAIYFKPLFVELTLPWWAVVCIYLSMIAFLFGLAFAICSYPRKK